MVALKANTAPESVSMARCVSLGSISSSVSTTTLPAMRLSMTSQQSSSVFSEHISVRWRWARVCARVEAGS